MGKHHQYGPSNFPAWDSGCLLYRSNHLDTKSSTEGTAAHAELEKALTNAEYIPDNIAARRCAEYIHSLVGDGDIFAEISLMGQEDYLHGIHGTLDACWTTTEDGVKVTNILDFKTFSDGATDYFPQLKGYAALILMGSPNEEKVRLHVYHGGVLCVETMDSTYGECYEFVSNLLEKVLSDGNKPSVCKWCQWCSKIKECEMTNKAITIVKDNSVAFNNMSICQKLVILDVVDKLSKSIREQAKAECIANGGKLEMDGICYEIKSSSGKGSFDDLTEVASAFCGDCSIVNKNGESVPMVGITQSELLSLCDLSKSKLIEKIKERNKDNKKLKKVDIESEVEKYYTKGSPIEKFVRTK